MDHYMKMASEYLEEFEGWSLYPSWTNPYFGGGVLLGIGWLASIVSVLMAIGSQFSFLRWDLAGILVFEILWLLALDRVREMKGVATLRIAAEKYHRPFITINESRIYALSVRLGVDEAKFFSVAKECKELLDMQRIFRSTAEIDFVSYARKIYDPESKARLMAIALAAISFIAALTVRSIPGELDIFDLLSNQSFHTEMAILLILTAVVYFVWIGVLIIGSIVFEGVVMWFVKLGVSKGKSYTALRYLVRDLVRFHKPAMASTTPFQKKPYRLAKSIKAH